MYTNSKLLESALVGAYCIVVKANADVIIEALDLAIFDYDTWEGAARYIYSHLSIFTPFKKERMDPFVMISPDINGWRMIHGNRFNDFEDAVKVAKVLSERFGESFTFFRDFHSDFDKWAHCENGKVLVNFSRYAEDVQVKGSLPDFEKDYIESSSYFSWDLEILMQHYFFALSYITKDYYSLLSVVCIMPKELLNIDMGQLPYEEINIWKEDYADSNDVFNENDELPF